MREEKFELDLETMRNPEDWPRWPLLPLVKRKEHVLGVLIDNNEIRTTVVVMNIWNPKNYGDCEQIHYDSFEDIVASGWEVD